MKNNSSKLVNNQYGKTKINLYLSIILIIEFIFQSIIFWLTERELPSDFEVHYMPISFHTMLPIIGIISSFFIMFGLVNGVYNMYEKDLSSSSISKLIFKNFDIRKSLLFYLLYIFLEILPMQLIQEYTYIIAECQWILGLIIVYLAVNLFFIYKFSLVPFLFRYESNLKNCFVKSWKLTSDIEYFKLLFKINIAFLLLYVVVRIITFIVLIFLFDTDGYFFSTILPAFIVNMGIGVWAGWSINVTSKIYGFVKTKK